MPLNRKRRIFRSSGPGGFRLISALAASRRVVLVAAGVTLALTAGTWLAGGPSDAPARATAVDRIVADPTMIAVLDGDTLRMHDRVVRLDGLTAPARGTDCRGPDQRSIDCGVAAANALSQLIRAGLVDCRLRGQDRHGRPIAECAVAGESINRAMVAAGWARADGPTWQTVEQRARTEARGLWATARP